MKLGHHAHSLLCGVVAPHAGAWIETRRGGLACDVADVAPHEGAWIETSSQDSRTRRGWSPPTRGRGLKLLDARLLGNIQVAPHAGAWIETA